MSAARAMSERQLDDAVRAIVADIARLGGWRLLAYHTRDSRGSTAGFPDWTFAGARGVMFRENKTARGQLRAEQADWLAVLRTAGADAAVWRPADLHSGRIARELAHLAGLRPVVDDHGRLNAL